MWMSRTVKDTVDCERRRVSGRRFSPPERQRLRTRAAKRLLWRRTLLVNHSLALKDQELPRENPRKIHARWVCLQYKSKMKRRSVYEKLVFGWREATAGTTSAFAGKRYRRTCQSFQQVPDPYQPHLSQSLQNPGTHFPRSPCYPTEVTSRLTVPQISSGVLWFFSPPPPPRGKCHHCSNDSLYG